MLVSGWILLATAAVVVSVVVFLCLVLRRALTELFFWRGAYRVTTGRASELLEQASATQPRAHNGGTSAPDMAGEASSPLKQHQNAVDSVRREAARLKIDWVSDDDAAYYRSQHDVSAMETVEPAPSVVSRFAGYATRR